MRTADRVCACLLVVLGGLVLAEGLRLGIGWSTDGPRPGFFLFWLGLALGAGSLAILGQAWWGSETPLYRRRFVQATQLAPVVKVAVPALAMVALTHAVGLYLAGALYLGVYMRWLGQHAWTTTVALALGIPLATFLVFEIWFLVPLPKGPLEALLGF